MNISPVQLSDSELVPTFAREISRAGIAPQQLFVEVTESTLIRDASQARSVLERLRDLGVGVAMDDFGTGYASLTYLQDYPIDIVKIDRSFVANITENAGDRAIVRAMTALVHELGLTVVAEGVERKDQLEILRSMGCDVAQGFYFEAPVPDPNRANRP